MPEPKPIDILIDILITILVAAAVMGAVAILGYYSADVVLK